MQYQGSVQNLSRQTSQHSLSQPQSHDQQYQQQYSLGRQRAGGQPSPYVSRRGEDDRRSHDQVYRDDRNASNSSNLGKVDNLTMERNQRHHEQSSFRNESLPRHAAGDPHQSYPQYSHSGDPRKNLSYESRSSDQNEGGHDMYDPRVSRHASQRSINYPDSREQAGHNMLRESHDPSVARHESQRSLNHPDQQHHQSSHASHSRLPTDSPYMSRRQEPMSARGSQSQMSLAPQRQQEYFPNVSTHQTMPVTTLQRDPPSRQPPSPHDAQGQGSRSQQDIPPSPYMSRHQGGPADSPYMSRHPSQRSVGQRSDIPQQSNVSRHESQRSLVPPQSQQHYHVYHQDGHQPSSASSTLSRQPHYQQGPQHNEAPSATSTLLRQSHHQQPPHLHEPPSASSTLSRDYQQSGRAHQSQIHGSQTSVGNRPVYTRQDSGPPPPYQTHKRQHSRDQENSDTMRREQSFLQQSMNEEQNKNTSQVARSQSQVSHHRSGDPRLTPKLSRNESERSVARSQHSRASSLSNSHPIPDARATEASHIIDLLEKEIVYLTGGRDRQGGPVVTFPPHRQQPNFNSEDITTCMNYLAQIPSEESMRRGVTVVIDSRDGSWSNLVTVLGCLKESLGDLLKQVLVVKPDSHTDRRPSSNSFRRDRPNIEPQFVTVNRLYTFVDRNQLTAMFDGTLSYRHDIWLRNRLDLEKFIRETRAASNHLDNVEYQIHQRLSRREPSSPLESARQHKHLQQEILHVPSQVIRDGKDLLNRLQHQEDIVIPPGDDEPVSTLDHLEAQKQVKRLIQYMENRIEKLENLLEDEDRSVITNQKFEDLQRHIKAVLSWILGPGEKLLASQTDIGDSYETADVLRKRHEELEIKCTDTYGQYAELRHKADELIAEDPTGAEDIRSTRDYMDTVFRSFASRLERRRNLLITSVRFHRLAQEFSKKLDDLLELVCSEPECEDVKSVEKELKILEDKCDSINTAAQSTLGDGQSLLDEMSRPIKNASGKDITPDYSRHIKHINQSLEELQERKLRCDELADVRKLKLQQILQLCTCEHDAEQAIMWILELCGVMANTHTNMGKTHEEAEKLQNDHKKFESTAQSTYEYGKQLLQAALVLRRSLRHDLEPNNEMTQRLDDAWWRFSQGTNERANRLTVSAMFLASVEKIFDNIEKILLAISQTLSREQTVPEVLQKFSPLKHQVDEDYKDTMHMGKALLERLSLPVVQQEGRQIQEDQSAAATINSKLRKLEHKKVDMDRYWGEMEYTKQPPQVDQVFSPKRQRTIPTIPNRTNTAFDDHDKSIYEEPVPKTPKRPWTSEANIHASNVPRNFRSPATRVEYASVKRPQNQLQTSDYSEIGPYNQQPRRERSIRKDQSQLQASAPNLHYAEIGPYGTHQPQRSDDSGKLHYAEIGPYGQKPMETDTAPRLQYAEFGQYDTEKDAPKLQYADIGPYSTGQPVDNRKAVHGSAPKLQYAEFGEYADKRPVIDEIGHDTAPKLQYAEIGPYNTAPQQRNEDQAPHLQYAEMAPYGTTQQRPEENDLLKQQLEEGAEWIRVRVHQMEPDLMEVGSTLEEALQYRQEHHEMLNKLKAKEQEIKQILTSADQYAAENTSQAEVYAAMADTMGEAWKELNNKLEYRGILLDDSVHFHQSAADFSSKMEQAQSKFSSTYPTQDVNTARRLLQQHQDIKRSILESSKTTHDIGHSLVRRIQDMGMHADLQNRHATTAACYGIEHVLELLQDRRRRLEEIWEQRRIQLEQCLQLCQLDQEVNKILDWFRQTGFSYLQNTDLGDCHQRSQIIQHEHYKFETQAKETQETVLRLVRTADQLLRRSKLDVEGVRQRLQTVDTECENFMIRLDTRRKNITMATSFFEQTESALTRLDQVEVQLNTMDLPRNSAELADRHSQLSNAIMEISSPPLRDGRILLERVSRDDRGADGIRRLLAQLQDRCTRLESLCKARRAEAWERSQAYLHFQEKFTSLQTWLLQIGQATLSRHADLGTRLESAEDFLEIHEQLDQDIRDKNSDLEALFEAGVNLVKSGDQEAHNAAEKVDTLHQQMQRIHRVIEFRITLSLVYLSFHKKVQQFQNNAGGLEHILKSEKEHLQDLTDSAVQHTQELWNITSQQYHEVDDKGREFLSKTSTINDDSSLNIKQAVLIVERIMTETRESMTTLTTTWESWQQKVSSSRQFKTQWHQFIQDARKTIDKCMKMEKDFFFPNIGGYLGNSSATAEEMQIKCQEFEPLYMKGLEELENHMTTGEMLLMKGDTRGQLDQIMNELTKVYHRFKARIHEYHILVKMTIQFFRNLDQLDKLIEKTEQEYSQSNLPADLTHAEKMLEEHKRKKTEVSSLINYTADEGEKIVVRVRQTDAEAAAQEDVERVLNVTAEYKQRWNQAWEDQEKRLKQNLQICQFNYDLRQIHSEIDELHHHLQARRGSYGNSLPASKMTSQAFKQFEMTVELIEKKINKFTSTAELMVQDHHYDSAHIGREIDMLNTKWTTFHMSVRDYRKMIDTSIDYYQLTEETEQWLKDGNNLLNDIGRKIVQCKTPQEVDDLVKPMDQFLQEGKPKQEERLRKLSELAVELYGNEGPSRVHDIFAQNEDLMQSLQQASNQVTNIKHNLQEREVGPPVAEQAIQPMEVMVTASAQRSPPKILKHLQNAEVVEGEKFTFESHVDTPVQPTVIWYKDNMPLNSPDYETRYSDGIATLTIEETFSEDTARYTVKFNTYLGSAESSAHLTVRALDRPVIHQMTNDISMPEGKGFKIEVIFSGSPTPEVAWFRGQDRVVPSSVFKITIEINRTTLQVTEAYPEDSGSYTVILQNAAGEIQKTCQVNVESFYSSAAEDMSQASAENEPMAPSFTQKLAPAREAMEGSRVRLDCVLVGHPEPEVVWFHNDKPVKESKDIQLLFEGDRCTLSIQEAYLEDAGVYRCEARNPYGNDQTVSKLHVEPLSELSDASVNEATPPKFTQLLRDLNVQSGHRVCLQCRVTGHPIPDVQWFKDGKPIELGPDYQVTAFADVHNLTIPEAFVEDTGTYMVKAVNMVGEAKSYAKLSVKTTPEPMETSEVMKMRQMIQTKESQETKLVKKELEQSPPEFQRLFHDMTVNAGEPVNIECSISGSPKPKVTWYFNGMPIVSRDYIIRMEGTRHTLHIPETFDEDSGRFSITAENPLGKATCSAYLFVEEESTIPKTRIFGSSEMTRRVSKTETVSSHETRISRFIETQETQQPTYIPSSEQHSTTITTDVTPQYDIRPIETRETHATTLKTDVKPRFQPVDLTIAVPVPPKFVQALKNIETMEGTRVTFEGVVSGKPEPSIKWYREGKELTDKADFEISYHDGRVSLNIPEAFPEDQGQFKCTARNMAGQASSSAELIVKASMVPPSFIQRPQTQTVKEGKPVRFTIRVAGQPPPEITWYKDGSKITSSPDFELVQEDDIHSLCIPEVFYEDAGQYTVEAKNPAGQTQCTANLRIEVPMEESVPDKPQPVTEERFEPKRAPAARSAPEEPTPKVRKLQLPSDFVKKTESPREVSPRDQRYREEVKMEMGRKPDMPTYEQTFRLPAGEPVQVTPKQKPRFTQPLQNKNVDQGEPVVFEARVEAHPEPIIKWYRDDVVVRSSPDYEITYDNGVCRLSIAETFPEDSGVFKVIATNADGSDTTQAKLQVQRSPIMSPVSEAFKADKAPTREERIPSPIEPEAPRFTQLPQNQKLKEGTNTVFDCTVTGKPFPDVSWRKRGFPIRVSQRYRITIDENTGRITLTIVNSKPDDVGQYTCTAVNLMGQTDTTATLIQPEEKMAPPPPAPKTWQPMVTEQPLKPWQQQPEMTQQPTRPWYQQPDVTQQPVKPWQQQQEMAQPRKRSDFFVPRSEKNLETNIQYRLSQEREVPIVTSTLEFTPTGFEQSLMQRQFYKEGHIKFSSETETSEYESDVTTDRVQPSAPAPPKIVQELKDFRLLEGSDATFVCRITGRPRPKVAWYKNGQRIKRSTRYEMKYNKDGYSTLRIRMALPEDAGHYTVLAVNSSGKDTCSSELYVDSIGNIDSTSFVGKEALDKILGVDKDKDKRPEEEGGIMEALSRPLFKKVPEDREVREGNTVRFDTLVSGRPAPELTWYRDDVQVHNDDQHKIVVNEDGVNSLIILAASRNDSGHYTCLANNKAGENSFTVELKILEKEQMQPPRFVERIQNFNIREGQPVTLRCQVIGIPQPMISWQKDGKMLIPNKPYRIETEGGRSTLTIDTVEPFDSAWFQCSAANVAGTATTRGKLTVKSEVKKPEPKKKITIQKKQVSPVKEVPEPAPKPVVLRPTPKPQPITPRTDSPPDLDRESAVREFIRREGETPAEEDIYTKDKQQAPKFKTPLKDLTNLKENDKAHFECKLAPYGAPKMKVEWYKDGEPLHHGHRFKPLYDFGFVVLDIKYVFPEDSGTYTCKATNQYGEDEVSCVVKVKGKRAVISDTQLPGEGAIKLQEMEEHWRTPMILDEQELHEPKKKRHPPSIDLKPEPIEVAEGEPAKFMVKVSGHPRPRVTWWVNETQIMAGSRFQVRYDGMMHYMTILKVREYEAGQVRVVTKNSEGEAEASTTLSVVPKDDWRSKLRQAPKGELEIELDRRHKIELRTPELQKAFEKPRATEFQLKQIERAAETRVKMKHDKEIRKTEYVSISSQYRQLPQEIPAARAVRQDRPEIQIDIQKAKIIPVMPEQQPEESKMSETFITLERREAPVFTKPLRPSRITEGKPVTLEVHYKGFPPPIISWYRDNFEIQPSHDFQINTTETVSTLSIPEVFPEDTGMFTVKAYNMYGTVQCKAKLTVIEEEEPERDQPPEFRSLIRDTNSLEGEPATFDCQVSGRPKPTVAWQKDGHSIPDSPRTKFIEEDENNTFLIYEVKPEDAGQYSCVALNPVGKATCTARLNVELPVGPPEILEKPKPIEAVKAPAVVEGPKNNVVDEGEPATFVAKISGYPVPVVTWYRNNQIVKPSKYFQMETTPEGTHSLNILEAFPEDTGTYRCVARNKAGEVTSSAFLKVHGLESETEQPQQTSAQKLQPPSITKPITNTLVTEGSGAKFECQFSGQPQPEIKWLRNGLQVIQDSRNYKIERNPNSTVLTIKESFPEDSGLITCRLKNAIGQTECSAELYVQETAPQPEEEAELVPAEETKVLEGQDIEVPDKVITSTTEITTLDTTGSDIITSETEEVSFEIVTKETAETVSEEFTIEETPLPEEKEVPLKATVPEVSQTFTEETEVLISQETQPEDVSLTATLPEVSETITEETEILISEETKPEDIKEEITIEEQLCQPKEELPQFEEAPEEEKPDIIEQEEEVPTSLTGEAPVFTTKLQHFNIPEGQTVKFICIVKGIPRPDVTWILDDHPITDAVTYKTEYLSDGTCTLEIEETFKEDEGEYICKATNTFGSAKTTANLTLKAQETEQPVEEIEEISADFKFDLQEKPDEGDDVEAEFRLSETVSDSVQDVQAEFRLSETLSEKERLTAEEEKEIISDEEKRRSLSVSSEEIEEEISTIEEKPESPVTITVEEKEITKSPEIIQYLQDISAQDGGQAQLVCKVTGLPRPTVTWYKGEEMIFPSEEFKVSYEGDECTLIIADVYPEDAGQYKVVAKNDVGTAMTTCDLSVLAPEETVEEPEWLAPSFIQKPKFQTVDVGQTVMFEAKIVANPGPQIHWTRNDIPLSSDKKIQIETKQDDHLYHTTIQLTDVMPEDAGTYKVTSQNDYGEASVSVSLLVKKPSGPEQTDFREKLQTQVKTKVGVKIKAEQVDFRSLLQKSTVKSKKFAEDVTGEDVTEEQQAEQKDFRDILKKADKLEAPEFVKTIKNQEIPEGDEVKFVTKVKGKPEPTVTWFHDDQTIVSDDIYKVIPGEEGESTLLLPEAFPEDSGKYSVQAENEAGKAECSAVLKVITEDELDAGEEAQKPEVIKKVEVVEQEAEQLDFRDVLKSQVKTKVGVQYTYEQLDFRTVLKTTSVKSRKFDEDVTGVETTVTIQEAEQVDYRDVLQKKQPEEDQVAPEFVVSIGDMKIQEGESTKFTVKAKGQPAPEIQWFVNNAPIKTDDIYQVIPGEEGESTLVLSEAFPEDSGVYTVKAINEAGRAEATALLTVNELIEAESPQPEEEEDKEEVTSFVIKPEDETEAEITVQISEEKEQPKEDIEEEVIIQPETEEEESSTRSIPEDVSYEASFEEDYTVSADMSIEEPTPTQPKDIEAERLFPEDNIPEQQEGYVMVSDDLIPEKPTEEEFTIISKEEIPSLDLPKTASDDDKDVKPYSGGSTSSFDEEKPGLIDRPIKQKTDEDISISSDEVSEEDIEEDISVSSATSEEEIEEKGFEVLMPDIVPKEKDQKKKDISSQEIKSKAPERVILEDISIPDDAKKPSKEFEFVLSEAEKGKQVQQQVEEEIILPLVDQPEFLTKDITEQIDIPEKPTPSDIKFLGQTEEGEITAPVKPLHEEQPVDITGGQISKTWRPDVIEQPTLPSNEQYRGRIQEKEINAPERVVREEEYPVDIEEEDISEERKQDVTEEQEDYEADEMIIYEDQEQPENIGFITHTIDYLETVPEEDSFNSSQDASFSVDDQPDGPTGEDVAVEKVVMRAVIEDQDIEESIDISQVTETFTADVSEEIVIPQFLRDLSDQEVTEGDTVTFIVQLAGSPFPEISWYKDGKLIESGDHYKVEVRGNFASLILKDVMPDDDAEYTVKATNEAGTTSSVGQLFVNPIGEAPTFISRIDDKEIEVGAPIVLECQIRGHPKPRVSWLKDGEEIIGDRFIYDVNEETAKLTILDTIPEDEGEYTIKAINDKGVATSSAEVLIQLEAPKFTDTLKDVSAQYLDTAVLECNVQGKPTPKVTWLANDAVIEESAKYHIRQEGDHAVLEIHDVSLEDSDIVYSCRAENAAGEIICSANVETQGILL